MCIEVTESIVTVLHYRGSMLRRLWEQVLCPLCYSGLDINQNTVEHYLNSQDLPCWKHNLICSDHGQSYYGKPTWEKRRVTCFCAGPGIWNIQGPLQNPGISYCVDSLSVRITHFPLSGLRSWRQLASEKNGLGKTKVLFFKGCWSCLVSHHS